VIKDSLDFLAVGIRNRRAYIRLSPEGEMTGYTGVIPMDAPREYATVIDGNARGPA
jgi:hypothetical protein